MNDTQRPHVFIDFPEWHTIVGLLEHASLQLPRRSAEFEIMFRLWRKLHITKDAKRFVLEVENQ